MADQDSTAALLEKHPSTDTFPLDLVLNEVNEALEDYRKTKAADGPQLSAVDVQFKTTTDVVFGATISFFIFTIGGSRTSETVNDVTFHFQSPKKKDKASLPELTELMEKHPQILLRDDLTKAIKNAAEAIKNGPVLKEVILQKLTISISFGVKWDVKGGITVPMMVTVGVTAEANKNAVQTLKLEFEVPAAPPF